MVMIDGSDVSVHVNMLFVFLIEFPLSTLLQLGIEN